MVGYSGSSGAASGELDERLVAKAALDAAEEQLESLCASHAGAFVSVERRGAALAQALKDLQLSIKSVEHQVTDAQQSLDPSGEQKSLQEVSERHRVRRRTLLQHSSLLELLELPSLMDACVRSNLYEQALAIAAFSNTLERRHGFGEESSAAVVEKVILQIRCRQADLRRHLLHRLKSSITMPVCLEVVTALRRLNSIDLERQKQQDQNLEKLHAAMELRLQVDFLEARDAWLDSFSKENKGATNSEHLLDTIERYRTRCFEIATQFLAIFRANSVVATKQNESSPSSLLAMWTTRRVHSFLSMLALELQKMNDTAALRDTLEASVFFATSMGRLGADFCPLLPPLLEPRALSLVVAYWTDGVGVLQETLKACRNAGVAFPLVSNTATNSGNDMPYVDGKTPPPPPRQLLQLPPLARFLNAYLTGLNELRRCLFAGNYTSLRNALKEVIKEVKQILTTHERAVLVPGLRGEAKQLREVAARYIDVFDTVLEPYMRAALEVALGDFEAAKVILPKKEIEEVEDDPETPKETDESEVFQAEDDNQAEDEIKEDADETGEVKHLIHGTDGGEQPNVTTELEQDTSVQPKDTVPVSETEPELETSDAVVDAVDEEGWKEDNFGDM